MLDHGRQLTASSLVDTTVKGVWAVGANSPVCAPKAFLVAGREQFHKVRVRTVPSDSVLQRVLPRGLGRTRALSGQTGPRGRVPEEYCSIHARTLHNLNRRSIIPLQLDLAVPGKFWNCTFESHRSVKADTECLR